MFSLVHLEYIYFLDFDKLNNVINMTIFGHFNYEGKTILPFKLYLNSGS